MASWFALAPTAERPVKGRVNETGFRIRPFHFMRKGGETEASGRFAADPAGTTIRVRLGMRLTDRFFLLFWLAYIAFIWTLFGAEARREGGAFLVWLFPAMLVFGPVLIAFLRWLSRGDGEFLMGLIGATCEATDERARGPIE